MTINTSHAIINSNSNNMEEIQDGTVSLVVTSPPYPMIEMWDELFISQNPAIKTELEQGKGQNAFDLMHKCLDDIWEEVDRVLIDSGFVCINIGDATRTLNKDFCMYSNHSRIIKKFVEMGYSVLPDIIWRKTTNAPNKFMGSGMLPSGAYVTYEHEYILIFRKGGKRTFKKDEIPKRQESAFFWEERNVWFSDIWNLKGVSQKMIKASSERERSAAFPFELAYRLINMYSMKDDIVLDPFLGTGTTTLAAMASRRNSIGVEIDKSLVESTLNSLLYVEDNLNKRIIKRYTDHIDFINQEIERGKDKWYENPHLNSKVKTRQEKNIKFETIKSIELSDFKIQVKYQDLDPLQQIPQSDYSLFSYTK
ncbi:DNA-methyltransferase [Bhargavaea beijingensis]|uniref:DNA-methyltransferase n=1 Tax=Bhargavaea beijingensis TaxID=426756 RepID=UPI0022254DE8|nr:site-specific DNA-methyltransferase [Bhargavaea beijingensis]MCW1929550.1 site-specific DNA-methyltransferase [Bhargavaea beijingensis]